MREKIEYILSVIVLIAGIYSCASPAMPTGGPKDETPPVFMRSTPMAGMLGYNKSKVEIYFDENILLDKPGENIVISPPQKQMPEIKSSGKKITVELKDTLQPNTTYTIDFGDAVVDNNEKNPYPGFVFSFSTGETIDSLAVSGLLLNARDLEPVTGFLIGLHKNLNDSAFTTDPFYRISRSDIYGKFSVKNLAEGQYKIYALNDLNRDYKFSQPGEDIAFSDSVIIPRFEFRQRNDTIWKDSITVDTVITKPYTHFLPDDILLRAFKEKTIRNQFLQKQERLIENKFSLYFNAPSEKLPEIVPLNFKDDDWYLLEKSVENDTLHYWITNPEVFRKDTLVLQVNYLKTDTAKKLVPVTDTLNIAKRMVKTTAQKKKKDDEKEDEPQFFKPTVKSASNLDLYLPVSIEWESPVKSYNREGIHLEIKSDTIWKPFDFRFEPDTAANIRSYRLSTKWTPNGEYRFQIDSAAFVSIYDTYNEKFVNTFKTKKLEDYGFIYFNLTHVDTTAFVELLDKSDKIVRTSPVKNGTAEFLFLQPGTYYARIVLDVNNNGIWDTGNYGKHIQPETVYYYDKSVLLPANFEIEQDWNVAALPLEKQKPKELIKNKPKEKPKENTRRP
ncbi:MAG: Ig-like domain-containing protein [Candidatus Azobacteroides sp.]|nr:Ig-like domain-containing protein [Candidatus Azobacteroides sp.]